MKDPFIGLRNTLARLIYRHILKPIFFRRDPEEVHDTILKLGHFLGATAITRMLVHLAFGYSHPLLRTKVAGIEFQNPIGLAAGFDKNGTLTQFLPMVGFGFEEVGSITAKPSSGNPKPRIWRLPKSRALVVHYGLANEGAVSIVDRLQKEAVRFPLGISIAKTNCKETADTQAGIDDYIAGYREAQPVGAYYTINISCPNAFGGQPFTDPQRLERLLTALDHEPHNKPIFIKLSPDLSGSDLRSLIEVSEQHHIDGYICANLTKDRTSTLILDEKIPEVGGISGRVVRDISTAQIQAVYRLTNGAKPIIGVGGIFSAEDAYAKIRAGASLVQLITGMIYEGPQVIGDINRGLVNLLKRDGFRSVDEAVGVDTPLS